MLFVGGPRHAAEMTLGENELQFSDVGSGTRYMREPVTFTVKNDVTDRPEWTYAFDIMVHESIVNLYACNACGSFVPPNHHETAQGAGHREAMVYQPRNVMLHEQLKDAALRAMAIREGVKSRAEGVLPPPADAVPGNGAGVPAHPIEVFLMTCETCANDVEHSFPSLTERAEAARFHLDLHPGHVLTFETESING
jgi:hypothetical protein